MVAHQSQILSAEQQAPVPFVNNGHSTSTTAALGKDEHASNENEIKAAKIQARAAKYAAWIGAAGAGIAGLLVFGATNFYQQNDSRQKALNEYSTSIKELIASTDIQREDKLTENIVKKHVDTTQNVPKTFEAIVGQIKDENIAQAKVTNLQYARTLLVMRELDGDGDRKGQALRFLYETCLVIKQETPCHVNVPDEERFGLGGTNLDGISLKDAWMPVINLRGVYMRGADLQKANLEGADLTGAHMEPNPKSGFLRFLPFIGSWFHQKANLSGANLRGANLRGADLSAANLSGADLSGADLRFVNLSGVNLTSTKLASACYVEGKVKSFPPNFQPAAHGMRAIPEGQSDPSKPNFQRCTAP